jgi:hypothetical protein
MGTGQELPRQKPGLAATLVQEVCQQFRAGQALLSQVCGETFLMMRVAEWANEVRTPVPIYVVTDLCDVRRKLADVTVASPDAEIAYDAIRLIDGALAALGLVDVDEFEGKSDERSLPSKEGEGRG